MPRLVAYVEAQRYCENCDEYVLARRKGTNHVLHAVLAVVTAGLWLLVWPVVAWINRAQPYLCQPCGSPTVEP